MENQLISEIESHKHLDVYLFNDCSWHKHVDYINEKAWCRINVTRRLKFFPDRKSLETIYLTFIRPVLEYAGVVWAIVQTMRNKNLTKYRQMQLGL